MSKYLDFEKEEKGYKPFVVNRENVRNNIGKKICYVNYVEPYRGTYFVRYGILHSIRYTRLFFGEGHDEIDIRNILEAGIEI